MKNKSPIGIYVHIPFCKRKCYYCDFCSSTATEETKELYVSSLINEISSERVCEYFRDRVVDSIYFGGGTPTCLSTKDLCLLLETVSSVFSVSDDTEITLECNPGTVQPIDLLYLRRGGFNRLSLGVQSSHDTELQALGRIHNFKDFEFTFSNARSTGFDNISIDLMYGIPFQSLSSFEATLNTVTKYHPEHISAYSLKIEPGTDFYNRRGSLILPDEDCEYEMYNSAVAILEKFGYEHYEISNYARPGCRSRHNLKYWNCDDYVGFGISAHSCIGTNRYSVTPSIKKYTECNGKLTSDCISLEESLTIDSFAEEYIMMRMRLSDGIFIADYEKRFGSDFEKYFTRMLPFIKSGHIIYCKDSGSVHFSKEGMYVSNFILSSILDLA